MIALTELQAIEILDKVRLEYKGTPQDHVVIAQAIEKIKELIGKIKELEDQIAKPVEGELVSEGK